MAIPQDRMSTEVVEGVFIAPEERTHGPLQSFEAGPIALNDPSAGLSYQVWELVWEPGTGNFVVYPETTGGSFIILNVADVLHCSFAFDNNGHVNIAYTVGGDSYLYWYDTNVAGWVTTALTAGTTKPTLNLDDKRTTQTNSNDILLWYTKQQVDFTWNLYKREQRERFLDEQLMATGVFPYIYKVGMNDVLRGQLALRMTA